MSGSGRQWVWAFAHCFFVRCALCIVRWAGRSNRTCRVSRDHRIIASSPPAACLEPWAPKIPAISPFLYPVKIPVVKIFFTLFRPIMAVCGQFFNHCWNGCFFNSVEIWFVLSNKNICTKVTSTSVRVFLPDWLHAGFTLFQTMHST